MAINSSPGRTVRESIDTPATPATGSRPAGTGTPSASATSATRHRIRSPTGSASISSASSQDTKLLLLLRRLFRKTFAAQNLSRLLAIVKLKRAIAQNLRVLVAFACQQHDVSRARFVKRHSQRRLTILLDSVVPVHLLQSHNHVVDDAQRVFRARIVARQNHQVAQRSRCLAHQRTGRTIPLSPGAKERDDASRWIQFARRRNQIAHRIVRMRVIHHHVEWLPFVNLLKTSRHQRQIRNSLFDFRIRNFERDRSANRRQNVVHINSPHKRRAHLNLPRWSLRGELQALKTQRKLLRRQIRLALQPICECSFRKPLKPRRVRIVRIDHSNVRHPRAGSFKQTALRRKIILKRLVKIQMVARQIRKNRRRKMATPHALERQRVRTHLQHRVRTARVAHFREHLLQIERFGRRVRRLPAALRRPVSGRSHKAARESRGLHNRIRQKRSRRLSIRAGDSHQLQRVRWMPVKICSRLRERPPLFTRRNFNPSSLNAHVWWSGTRTCNHLRATPNRSAHELIAIYLLARQREEHRIRLDLAAVVCNRMHRRIGRPAHANARNPLQYFRKLHLYFRGPIPAALRTTVFARFGSVPFHNETQFPAPFTDAGTSRPALPNRTVSRVPRTTCVPASTDCSNATPLPISAGTSPIREHASVTLRTVCPARFGTITAS